MTASAAEDGPGLLLLGQVSHPTDRPTACGNLPASLPNRLWLHRVPPRGSDDITAHSSAARKHPCPCRQRVEVSIKTDKGKGGDDGGGGWKAAPASPAVLEGGVDKHGFRLTDGRVSAPAAPAP